MNKKISFVTFFIFSLIGINSYSKPNKNSKIAAKLPANFVYLEDIAPEIVQNILYGTKKNFIGRRLKGYKQPRCILRKEVAEALKEIQKELTENSGGKLSLMIYDGYRPKKAVLDILSWIKTPIISQTQKQYFPNIKTKQDLLDKGYISGRSGHSTGAAVDLTIVQKTAKGIEPLDMGTNFDFFDKRSWYGNKSISEKALSNRKMLRELMKRHNFVPYDREWWHFSLKLNDKIKFHNFDIS